MGYFDAGALGGATTGSSATEAKQIDDLNKALMAGYETDAAIMVNGRAMIPENLEATMMNVVAALKEDCKILNSVKKVPVRSTVHELNRRTSFGSFKWNTVPEGGASNDTDQAVERVIFPQKYIQTRRSVTKQMEAAETFEDAYTSEKLAGTEVACQSAEYQIFHGDAAVIPTEFDGFLAAIEKSKQPNIKDARGNSLGHFGEGLFDDVAQQIWDRGGSVNKALFPSVLARDVKELFTDRIRMAVKDNRATFDQLPDYPTAIGPVISFSGEEAGADKFYQVKGFVKADGIASERPRRPISVSAAVITAGESQFAEDDEGDYSYTVHSINRAGISEGISITSPIAVGRGATVRLTIKPDNAVQTTGFVICRTAKDEDVAMEMVRIPNSPNVGGDTIFDDTNKDLPGTASMLFLTNARVTPVFTFGQLLPLSTFPLYPTAKAETPFLILLYASLEVRAPEFCGLVKNLSYRGGLKHNG
ncbi:SU10 major capsid protein [Treponema sp. R6D11]